MLYYQKKIMQCTISALLTLTYIWVKLQLLQFDLYLPYYTLDCCLVLDRVYCGTMFSPGGGNELLLRLNHEALISILLNKFKKP